MNKYMELAMQQAAIAYNENNVPVGCVIVKDNCVIAKNHNIKNSSNISIYHAEMLCIIDACKKLNSWYLDDCIMYVTLKPCRMCEAAIAESRIKEVHYLLDSNYDENLNVNISYIDYKKEEECFKYNKMITDFFKNIR